MSMFCGGPARCTTSHSLICRAMPVLLNSLSPLAGPQLPSGPTSVGGPSLRTGIIRHNETHRFLMGGREVGVDRRGTETTTIVERPDGTRIITITDHDGRLIRRVRRAPDG